MTRHAANARRNATATANALQNPQVQATPSKDSHGALRSRQDTLPLTASQLLTAEQLAERWQVPKTQVWRLARDGAVPVVRIGRYMRFRRDAIERWEEAQTDA